MKNLSAELPKPPWLKVAVPSGRNFSNLKALMQTQGLHTVCEEALCPNIAECWGRGTAAFMILGAVCTRYCRFCAVLKGEPQKVDWGEPERLAQAVTVLKLRHVVITSVSRDDLPDGGASLFEKTIRTIRTRNPNCSIEALIPDFKGDAGALSKVMEAAPQILNHNMETVSRLFASVRPRAAYKRSLQVLKMAKEMNPETLTKSGFMVGLGETFHELEEMFHELRQVGCDILTIGQYLRPSKKHLPVARYYTYDEFIYLKEKALEAGFRWVESGPLVRSSYRAELQVLGLRASRPAIQTLSQRCTL